MMNKQNKIHFLLALQNKVDWIIQNDLDFVTQKAKEQNGWFEIKFTTQALQNIAKMLNTQDITSWIDSLYFQNSDTQNVGIVMAGNIPLVGFHDLICVLISGHRALIKLSSKDQFLVKQMIEWILSIQPDFTTQISIQNQLKNIDALMATGSDNTSKYFDYYFGHLPHIIRKNKTSVALLDGTENEKEWTILGEDIFTYFGLGCRNVSKIFIPKGFEIQQLFKCWEKYEWLLHNHLYFNNYSYQKTLFLMNKTPHFDNGFLLVKEDKNLFSPIGVLYYEEYENIEKIQKAIAENDKIQIVVGKGFIPFGHAQTPKIWEYADGINTIEFLNNL